jgi:hypothetical protein
MAQARWGGDGSLRPPGSHRGPGRYHAPGSQHERTVLRMPSRLSEAKVSMPSLSSIGGARTVFVTTAIGVSVAAVLASLIGSVLPAPGNQVAQPLLAAWVIALAYIWRPAPALTAWLVLTLFVNTWAHYQSEAILHLDEAVLPMLVLLALVRHRGLARGIDVGFKEVALAALTLAGLASGLLGAVPLYVSSAALILLLKAIAAFYVASWTTLRVEDVESGGLVILGIAGVTLALSLVEFLDPVAFREALGLPLSEGQRGAIPVVSSLFLQPGLFGWFTAFASLILYAYFIVFRRWWMLVAALVLSVGTIVSGRRRPLIGIVAAFLTAVVWQVRHLPSRRAALRAGVPLILSAILIVGISLPFFGEFYASTIDSYVPDSEIVRELALGDHELTREQSRTIQPRIALYAASIAIAREHFPLGVGFGRFGSHISRVFYSPAYEEYGLSQVVGLRQRRPNAVTDTFWPMLLGEAGVLGMLAYAAFVGAIAVGAWKRGHVAPSSNERAIHLAVLMILVLALVESTVAPTFIAPPVAYFVFVAAGVSVAVRAAASAGDSGSTASGPTTVGSAEG